MTDHRPVTVDTMDWLCINRDCEHDDPDDCPTTSELVCEACSDNSDAGDWTPVEPWPCSAVGDTQQT